MNKQAEPAVLNQSHFLLFQCPYCGSVETTITGIYAPASAPRKRQIVVEYVCRGLCNSARSAWGVFPQAETEKFTSNTGGRPLSKFGFG